ncbi:hypothetical protein SCAR479_13565 [Seiridium cardinale]|uniref:Uncharacterized protein n=1 Tax=Seiridium cardinale TaxID=138064 RepID=A0ABR2X7Q2_9PEZI
MGNGCGPGQAKPGDLLQVVEHAIRDRLRENPRQTDLESMENYINGLDVCQKYSWGGCMIHYTFVQKCIELYRYSEVPFAVEMSAGSRTSRSGRGSTSVVSQGTISSLRDSKDLNERSIPIQITTAEGRPRIALALKTENEDHDYIQTRVAGESGFPREAGSVINVMLTLAGESRKCTLHVRDIAEDMMLREEFLREFGSYIPEFSVSDWLNSQHDSVKNSTSATIAAKSVHSSQIRPEGIGTRGYGENLVTQPTGHVSSPSAPRSEAEADRDPRVDEILLGVAERFLRTNRR